MSSGRLTPTAPIYGCNSRDESASFYDRIYPPTFPANVRTAGRSQKHIQSSDDGYSSTSILDFQCTQRTTGGSPNRTSTPKTQQVSQRTKSADAEVEVVQTDMPKWLSTKIVEFYQSASVGQTRVQPVVKLLRQSLEKEFPNSTWCIIALKNDADDEDGGGGDYHVPTLAGYTLDLDDQRMGYGVRIALAKSSRTPRALRIHEGQFLPKLIDMDDKQLSVVKKLAFEALQRFDTAHERCEHMFDSLSKDQANRATWMIKCGPDDDGASAVTGKFKPNSFASFTIGPVLFEVSKILSR